MIQYKPFEERVPDFQYRNLLEKILNHGEEMPTEHGEPALTVTGHALHLPLANGFPMITERDIGSQPKSGKPPEYIQALGEFCAFLNGAQTQTQLEEFGCFWWDKWVTAENCARFDLDPGDLGPGSYGAAFRKFPTENGPFDQITALIEGIRRRPFSRYHVLSPWVPQYILVEKRRVVVPPCHGWVYVRINGNGELTLIHKQRSADAPVGLIYNFIHYAAFTMMLAQVTGYRAKELVYWLDDVHIYERQIEDVQRMLIETSPERFPTVTVEPGVTDIFAFRAAHFAVTDYYAGPKRRISTPL